MCYVVWIELPWKTEANRDAVPIGGHILEHLLSLVKGAGTGECLGN